MGSSDGPLVVGLDSSTQSCKAIAWSSDGRAVAEGRAVAAGAVGVAAVPLPGVGTVCVDCGAMAEGSRTSFALVQAASVSAASNDTVVACDRLICLKTPWR